MTKAAIDIVIPIWNKPNETRNCLVNLITFTPDARLVMLDNGSERETEKLLQEFADGLDDRALLMRDDTNVGFVRAANRGLERSEAPFVAVLKSTTQVLAGWLEPLLEFSLRHPEAGILVPRRAEAPPPSVGPIEVASCSFGAMVLTREAYLAIGGFDEGMDGGPLCLKDFTRRACSRGFLTYLVPASSVSHEDEIPFGSEKRREERLRHSQALFAERWGEEQSYLVHVPKGLELSALGQKLNLLQQGARYGDSYTVLIPALLYREAFQGGLALRHENVRLVPIPRWSTAGAKRRIFERLAAQNPGMVPVTAVDGIPFPYDEPYLSFTELSDRIRCR